MAARRRLLAGIWHRLFPMAHRMFHRPRARAAAVLVLLAVASSAAAVDVDVSVRRTGEALVIDASARLDADSATAWRVLTDYERYADFVPGMRSSHVVGRQGSSVTVVQSAEAPAWLMRVPFDVVYTITELPPDRIESNGRGRMDTVELVTNALRDALAAYAKLDGPDTAPRLSPVPRGNA